MRSRFLNHSTRQFPTIAPRFVDWPLYTAAVTTGGTSLECDSTCTGSPQAIRLYWEAWSKPSFVPALSPMHGGRRDRYCPRPPTRRSSTLHSFHGRAMRPEDDQCRTLWRWRRHRQAKDGSPSPIISTALVSPLWLVHCSAAGNSRSVPQTRDGTR